MESFLFGSVSGSTFAFYFFMLIAGFIGIAIYRLLLEPRLNKMFYPSMSRPLALTIGSGATLLVFLGIYFSSLDGFYRLEVGDAGQDVRLEYILPRRTLTLKKNMIAEARRVPTYKSRWQLILYTPTGAEYASARSDYASTRKAWEYLSSQLDPKSKP